MQDSNGPEVEFFQVYPDAVPPMRADQTALGTMPASALSYCEAMRTASSFGWYAFPAMTVKLLFDGTDTYIANGTAWERLFSENLPGIDNWWNAHCPNELIDMPPPFITALTVPGYVQLWTGFLVGTARDWSILVRPLANINKTNQFFCFEGVVETDIYSPAPLFINLKLKSTDTIIKISKNEPLFQVQPIHRSSYASRNLDSICYHALESDMGKDNWEGYKKTIRSADPTAGDHSTGQYAAKIRKRAKKEQV